jgi:secreted trypsin-like serine protease
MKARTAAAATITAVLTSLGIAAGTWLAPGADAVVGGRQARDAYPWLVNLSMSGVPDNESHVCGASMLTDRWAVTAAHCVDFPDDEIDDLVARVGSRDRLRGGEVRHVARAVRHPEFHRDADGAGVRADIALIELSAPVDVRPVRIGPATGPGMRTRIAGWGNTCSDPVPACDEFPVQLRELDAVVTNPDACSRMNRATELCTDYPVRGTGACSGDSGGPQVVAGGYNRWELVGVTSRTGNGENTCGDGPTIYTSARAFAGWINDTIAGQQRT